MIDDLDRTLKKLLQHEMEIKGNEITVQFHQPKREWSSRLSSPTLNLFLFDLRENNALRQHQWQQFAAQNGRSRQKRTPYRLDCHYVLTAWVKEPEDEHRLLSRATLAMLRHPIIPDQFLTGTMATQAFELNLRLAPHDKLTNPAELWSALDNELRLSVSCIVTLAFDPWTEIYGELVRSAELRIEASRHLPTKGDYLRDEQANGRFFIGGTIREGEAPQPNLQVALRGTGHVATTDKNGRYRFSPLQAGEYTLLVWQADDQIRQKKITVPYPDDEDNGQYDLTF